MSLPPESAELSIIIVNWNASGHLRRCLQSLQVEGSYPSVGSAFGMLEVIVVDNVSTDDSVAMAQTEFPEVPVLINSLNVGFARANNQGIRNSLGSYVMLLNPDTIVKPGALRQLVDFMDSKPSVGAVGPRLLNADGTLQHSCRSYPGIGAGFFRNTPLGRLFPHNRYSRHYLMTDWKHDEVREVDWLSGACLMVRRSVIEEVGLLDEDYFMYCEDIDWCYRMERHGWKKCYFPNAEVVHFIGKSSDLKIPAMIVAHHRSMCRYYFKHYCFGWRMLLMPVLLGGIATRCVSALLKYYFMRSRSG